METEETGTEQTSGLLAYHYTNLKAYRSMQTKGVEGHWADGFDDFVGLIPQRPFPHSEYGRGLPYEIRYRMFEGLLEPEPSSWTNNPEFPVLWSQLMCDIGRHSDVIILLSFQILPEDKVYVVDRAHVERELYRRAKGQGVPTRADQDEAYRKYWDSQVPVFDYDGSYVLPQLVIGSGIEFPRLNVEWEKKIDDLWERVVENDW